MVCAFTTRFVRTARWVATATAWAILGTSAAHATPPARTLHPPLHDPFTANASPPKHATKALFACPACLADEVRHDGSPVGAFATISAGPACALMLPPPPDPDFAPAPPAPWNPAVHLAVPSNERSDAASRSAFPASPGDAEEYGDPGSTNVAWLPDMPVVVFLLTGLIVALLRWRSLLAME